MQNIIFTVKGIELALSVDFKYKCPETGYKYNYFDGVLLETKNNGFFGSNAVLKGTIRECAEYIFNKGVNNG